MSNTEGNLSISEHTEGHPAFFVPSDARGGISAKDFLSTTFQLGAILLVIWQFQIEASYGLLQLVPLIFVGFLIHALIPLKFRLPGFLILSLSAIVMVLGLLHGAMVIGGGIGLIAIAHLPIPFRWRVSLIICVALLCAAVRANWITTSLSTISTVVVPVLAAMFMFRLAVYMYNLRFDKNPGSVWESLSYFFLLPNVIFLLFPVIDYKTFRRTYYDKPAYNIYQKGLLWMMRGIVHLLLYRAVYYHFTLSPSDVTDLGSAIHFMVSTYMLYLHISGQFHLIIGMLCLFGFNLPETHHLFYLASGFSDYWRRINIYWKDFMMTMLYYPVLMRARVLGMTTGIVLATLVVFIGTWVLHSYQWFWLRGEALLTATDATFWAVLWALVAVNSVIETKFRRKKKSLGKATWNGAGALFHSLKVVGMLVTITVLWTLWNSHTFSDFFIVINAAAKDDLNNWGLFLLCLASLVVIGVVVQYLNFSGYSFVAVGSSPSPRKAAINTSVTALALIILAGGFPFYFKFNDRVDTVVRSLSTERLNKADRDQMEAGYYEGLLNMGGYTSALARVHGRKPNDWVVLRDSKVIRWRDDLLEYELAPNSSDILSLSLYETNRWGMRDKDYRLEKTPGTYRIALLGASYNEGAGLVNEDVYEAILERKLNENSPSSLYNDYEILNFSLGGYSLMHQTALIEEKVTPFKPDAAILTVHKTEHNRLRIHLQGLVNGGHSIAFPEIEQALAQSEAHSDMRRDDLVASLETLTPELEEWALHKIASQLQAAGIRPIAVYLPSTYEAKGIDVDRRNLLRELCLNAGFEFYEVENPFLTDNILSLQLAEWDTHPNAEGHKRIADNFYKLIKQNPALIPGSGSVTGTDSGSK